MVNEANYKMYQTVYQKKGVTEYILGTSEYNLPYVEVSYKAKCIQGVAFSMFDKVICGLLQIEEELSFEDIADILGLNVVHEPENGKYIDYGEREVLEFALDNLIQFNMIETSDIHYSKCWLTTIGQEYTAKGLKFLPTEERKFKIYFDLLNHKHHEIKQGRFSLKKNKTSIELPPTITENEPFVKELAVAQIPDIYEPEQFRDFTDLQTIQSKVIYQAFYIVSLYSIEDQSIRHLVFDKKQKLNHSLSTTLSTPDFSFPIEVFESKSVLSSEERETVILSVYNQLCASSKNTYPKVNLQILKALAFATKGSDKHLHTLQDHHQKALQTQTLIQDLLAIGNIEKAIKTNEIFYTDAEIIEREFLESNLDKFFETGSNEVWIFLPETNPHIIRSIKIIINNLLQEENTLFIITPSDIDPSYEEQLIDLSKDTPFVIYIKAQEVKELTIISKNSYKFSSIYQTSITLEIAKGHTIKKNIFRKEDTWSDSWSKSIITWKKLIGKEHLNHLMDTYEKAYDKLSKSPKNVSLEDIQQIEFYLKQLTIFKVVNEFLATISLFKKKMKSGIKTLKKSYKIKETLVSFETHFQQTAVQEDAQELKELQKKLSDFIDKDIKDDTSELLVHAILLKDKIQLQMRSIS